MKDHSVNKSLASHTTGVRQTPSRGASASHKRGPPSRPGAFLDSTPGKNGDDYSAFKNQIGQSDMFGNRNSVQRPKRS